MSHWNLWVGLLACILLAACTAGGLSGDLEDVEPARSIPVKTSEFEGVILVPRDWVPTSKVVLAVEEQLLAYLTEQQHAFDSLQAPIVERLPSYRRQYWGEIENGKKVLVANFFCDAGHYDWMEQEVVVLDGGDCFFRLRYDVEAGTFFNLIVNGSA